VHAYKNAYTPQGHSGLPQAAQTTGVGSTERSRGPDSNRAPLHCEAAVTISRGRALSYEVPEIAFEASITIYTIWKGFKPSPILDDTRYAGVGEGSGSAVTAPP